MSSIKFEPDFSPLEKEILSFSPGDLEVKERVPDRIDGFLRNPMINKLRETTSMTRRPAKKRPALLASELSTAQRNELEKIVSLILITEDKKMAIINGFVLKEGDAIGGGIIARIEKDRVLFEERGFGEKWLKLD